MNIQRKPATACMLAIWTLLWAATDSSAWAQIKDEEPTSGVRYGDPVKVRYRAGLIVTAVGGRCQNLKAYAPVPLDWAEQTVRIVDEDISSQVRSVDYQVTDESGKPVTSGGTVRLMIIDIPLLKSGEKARALATFEIERRAVLAPETVDAFQIPTKKDRKLTRFLGTSPYIETRNRRIKKLSKELVGSQETAWNKVEAIYDYVRDNVEYKEGKLKGAVQALKDGNGDCEELTSLFIALCRSSKIPARTVWVPGHCYPEFYLVDGSGTGHWFPCQAAGTRAFGEMPDQRPILQKGDNFRVPGRPKEKRRYVAEYVNGLKVRGGGEPKVQSVRELLN